MQKSEELKLPEPDKKIIQSDSQHIDIKVQARQKPDEEQKHPVPVEPIQILKQAIDQPVVAEVQSKEAVPAKHRGRPPKNNKNKVLEQAVPSSVVPESNLNKKPPSET